MATATEPAGDAREDASDAPRADDARDEDEEEEETCGFCKYMKGGSCRAAFAAWEACVDAAKARDEDFVETCFETTSALRECMLRDPEYYGPMTGEEGERAEGAAEAEAEAETEAEAEAEAAARARAAAADAREVAVEAEARARAA
jgi:hypothetical protein